MTLDSASHAAPAAILRLAAALGIAPGSLAEYYAQVQSSLHCTQPNDLSLFDRLDLRGRSYVVNLAVLRQLHSSIDPSALQHRSELARAIVLIHAREKLSADADPVKVFLSLHGVGADLPAALVRSGKLPHRDAAKRFEHLVDFQLYLVANPRTAYEIYAAMRAIPSLSESDHAMLLSILHGELRGEIEDAEFNCWQLRAAVLTEDPHRVQQALRYLPDWDKGAVARIVAEECRGSVRGQLRGYFSEE